MLVSKTSIFMGLDLLCILSGLLLTSDYYQDLTWEATQIPSWLQCSELAVFAIILVASCLPFVAKWAAERLGYLFSWLPFGLKVFGVALFAVDDALLVLTAVENLGPWLVPTLCATAGTMFLFTVALVALGREVSR